MRTSAIIPVALMDAINIEANTTQPGTDGTFHRWWRPIEAVA